MNGTIRHQLPSRMLERSWNVVVVGAGGTGSAVLPSLARLHHAMLELGHPGGIDCTVFDDDTVSPTNVGRQGFYPNDVGEYKASLIVNRLNALMGTNWRAETRRFGPGEPLYNVDLVIGCVDTRAARAAIVGAAQHTGAYYLDCGNDTDRGQVVIGQVCGKSYALKHPERLPHVGELFPELIDAKLDAKDETPSCSMAYAEYYGVDGAADDDPEIEERIAMHRQPLVGYASRTGTRRNLAALKGADWRLLVSAKGELRTEGFDRYALDNGAWTAYQQGQPFDEHAFAVAVERLGERADWLVLPDIVMGGMASLDYSLKWLERLRGMPCRMLIAVQNGMQVEDLASLLSPAVGIFIGGSTEWKEQTAHVWGSLARRRHCYLHVGRVNSARRIRICAAAGADSFDGTSVSRYAKTLPRLDRATRQADMFAAAHDGLEEAQRATADLLI